MAPCCCLTSRTWSLVIGAVQITFGTLLTIKTLMAMEVIKQLTMAFEKEQDEEILKTARVEGIIKTAGSALLTLLGFVLVVGAGKAIPWLVKSWIAVKVGLLAATVGLLIYGASLKPELADYPITTIVLIWVLYHIWAIAVVWHFLMVEMGNENHHYLRNMTTPTASNLNLIKHMDA